MAAWRVERWRDDVDGDHAVIDLALDRSRDWLAPCFAFRDRPLHRQEDVEALIRRGVYRLHVGEHSAIVTELDPYPSGEVALHYWYVAGDMSELRTMHDRIEREAIERGATLAFGYGREGWARETRKRGYEPYSAIVRKILK